MKILLCLSAVLLTVLGQSTNTPISSPDTQACTNGKVFTSCGTMCPLTCQNKDNPPMICPLACKIGCACPSGMVENGDECVAPENCPAAVASPSPSSTVPACTNGNVYTTCGSSCPLTCANKNNPPSCIQMCVEGCFCPNGMVSNGNGACVAPENCPDEATGKPAYCSLSAVPGMCKASIPSFFYNSTSKRCEQFIYGGCGGNENRFETKGSCMETCGDQVIEVTTPVPVPSNTGKPDYCSLSAVPGMCKAYIPSFFYNSTSKRCEQFIYGGCGGNENRFETKDHCMNTCGDQVTNFNAPYVTPPLACPESDVSAFGACVIESRCANIDHGRVGECDEGTLCCSTGCGGKLCTPGVTPSPLCAAVKAKAVNESSGLLGAYVPQCKDDGTFTDVQCHEGMCWCVDSDTGKAKGEPTGPGSIPDCSTATVATTTSPSPSPSAPVCTNGKVFAECANMCPLSCDNKDNPPLICPLVCMQGCDCPPGTIEYKDGCVAPENCPTTAEPSPDPSPAEPTCTNGKVFNSCGTMCPLTCENKDNPPMICPLACKIGCACPSGMVENGDECVAPENCPATVASPSPSSTAPACTNGNVYTTCGSSCPLTCANKDNPPSCIQMCVEGCFCPNGMVSNGNGACVAPENCPVIEPSPEPACTNGKIFKECGTACPLTCENKDNPPMICPAMCKIGCACPSGMAENGDGCVAPENCPATTTSKPAYCSLPPVGGLCEAYIPSFFYNSTSMKCEQFVYGGCGGNENRFETKGSCMETCGDQVTEVSTTVPVPSNTGKPAYCSLSAVPGMCKAYIPSFFYNSTSKKCEQFIYGGCGGNENRFETKDNCVNTCGDQDTVHPTTTPVPTTVPQVLVTDAVYNAQKVCPVASEDELGVCEEHCTADSDCEDWEKCCSNGCGHSCMETVDVPYYSPPMQCPDVLLPICNFHFACASHDECEEDNYCCSTGCGAMCMAGVEATPLCATIRDSVQSSGLIGAYIPQCEKDGNFSSLQCHGSTGKCWCVDRLSGMPMSAPVTAEQPDCDELLKEDKCKGIMCDWPMCGNDVQPITDDDHCCPYCPADCQVGEESYPSGTSYKSPDGCNTCSCYNGMSMCTLMACAPQCTYNGKHYYSGQRFNATDGCNTCVCDGDGVACTEIGCLPVCKAGGIQMNEGEVRSDGCSECVCKNKKISCTLSENGCANPVTRSVDITMKFKGDFDTISHDLDGFKVSFRSSLVLKYQSLSLHESQITNLDVYRGSVVVQATLQDVVDEDGEETSPNTANITLVIIQLEQDYNSNDLTIQYQDITLEPSGEFSYQENEDDDDDDQFFFWSYIVITVAFVITVVLLFFAVVGIIYVMKKNRGSVRMAPVPTDDSFEQFNGKNKGGYSNPMYAKMNEKI